jgi:hypothetical protein
MISENLTSNQIISTLRNKTVIWFAWRYENVKANTDVFPEYTVREGGDAPFCTIAVTPNKTSTIMIHSLSSDADGGGLNSADSFTVKIAYRTTANPNTDTKHTMFVLNLADYTRYGYTAASGITGGLYTFPIEKSFKLSNIPNYKNIRVFSITIRPQDSYTKGNECNMHICYKQNLLE